MAGQKGDPGCTAKDNRRFVEAVLWIMRTGSPWRDLPEELGIASDFRPLALARERCLGAWQQHCKAMLTWSICS
ncbi:MAG: transposase [Burkholderiales bacterium]|nr:transposase [Burkholderiales bacterium]